MKRIYNKFLSKQKQENIASHEIKLPNFFIIGANKAGTTSLHTYCAQHPDIFMCNGKEPMFFLPLGPFFTKKEDAKIGEPYFYFTLDEYMELFSSATERLRGESSTAYLCNPSVSLWIKKIVPNAQLIAVLRNPLDRAYSDYQYHVKANLESRTFEQAIDEELDGFMEPSDLEKKIFGLTSYYELIKTVTKSRYLNVGLYGSQISIIKKYFSDKKFFIGDYEDFEQNSVEFLQRVFRFLDVDEFVPKDMQRKNSSDGLKYQFDKPLENKLKRFFEQDIVLLQSMVDFDVLKWLK